MTAINLAQTAEASKKINARPSLLREIVKARWAYLFVAPFFVLFALFSLYPILFSFYLSLNDWKGLGPMTFVGVGNYVKLLKDTLFWPSLVNGFILFSLSVPLMTLLALVLAVILNSKRVRGFRIFRLILFLPYITNMAAAGFTFRLLLQTRDGFVNVVLNMFGIGSIQWLDSVTGARVSVALLITWAWLGYNMVLMLAGLQTIPNELNEAAMIDGAGRTRVFFYITIPLMRPMLTFSLVLSTIGSFGLFTEVYTLTQPAGSPLNSTLTPIIAIFNQAFTNFRYGYASAMAYVYFAFIFVLTLFQIRYVSRRDKE
ncbi:MAG: carbohydrate ABC transporter permease [Aggregatilineales bacterium]